MANGFQSREIDTDCVSRFNNTGSTIARGRIVKGGASDTCLAIAAVTDAILGVAGEDIPNQSWGRVITRGTVPVLFGAALTVGARTCTSATGTAIAATQGNSVLGVVREVGANGVLGEVELLGPGSVIHP